MSNQEVRKHRIYLSHPGYLNGKWTQRPSKVITLPAKMSEKACIKAKAEAKAKFELELTDKNGFKDKMLFTDFSKYWFDEYVTKNKEQKTKEQYAYFKGHFDIAFMGLYLDEITDEDIQTFYRNLMEPGVRKDTKYHYRNDLKKQLNELHLTKVCLAQSSNVSISVIDAITDDQNVSAISAEKISAFFNLPKENLFFPVNPNQAFSKTTLYSHHRVLNSIFKYAIKKGYITTNPCDYNDIPKKRYIPKIGLSINQLSLLIAALEDNTNMQNKTMILLALYTGLRREELCGLEWVDIDFERYAIVVKQATVNTQEIGILTKEPKNDWSNRRVPVHPNIIGWLQKYKNWQDKYRASLGVRWENSNRLFTSRTGRVVNPCNILGWFKRLIATINKQHPEAHIDACVHSLRHSYAAIALMTGMSETDLASILGHKDSSMIHKTYAYVFVESLSKGANAVGAVYNGFREEDKQNL